MIAIRLCRIEDVRVARDWVRDLATADGLQDPGAAVVTAGELGNNCIEHSTQAEAWLTIGCHPGSLSLRFENRCARRPDWHTRKPLAAAEFRTGGYGLLLARSLAHRLHYRWAKGRVVVRAEFH